MTLGWIDHHSAYFYPAEQVFQRTDDWKQNPNKWSDKWTNRADSIWIYQTMISYHLFLPKFWYTTNLRNCFTQFQMHIDCPNVTIISQYLDDLVSVEASNCWQSFGRLFALELKIKPTEDILSRESRIKFLPTLWRPISLVQVAQYLKERMFWNPYSILYMGFERDAVETMLKN